MTHKTHICNTQEAPRADKSTISVDISHFNKRELKSSDSGSGLAASGSRVPLGIKTKSSSVPNINSIRKERYKLGRVARAIYAKQGEQEGLKYVLNYHRTAKCSYIAHSDVSIHVSCEHQRAFLSGITACGSVWTCSVCAAKIEERRRDEIRKGVEYWYSLHNKTVAMITLTFSHTIGDDLSDVLDKQSKALVKLRAGDPWVAFKKVFGFDSLIRSLEVTYSERNGWHPHTHELWCLDQVVDRDRLDGYLRAKFRAKRHSARLERLLGAEPRDIFEELLLDRWQLCCERVGLMTKADGKDVSVDAFREHSLDVKWDVDTGDYLAKQDASSHWGVDREMAKGSTKKGKKSGMHPFNFLSEFEEGGEGKWAGRWLEFTSAINNKRRIYWSAGLKRRACVDELTDEELAAKQDEYATVVYKMTKPEWTRARHNVPVVLECAEDGASDMREVIQSIEIPSGAVEATDVPKEESEEIIEKFPETLVDRTHLIVKERPVEVGYKMKIIHKNGRYIVERSFENGHFERLIA